jgi:hypothetical protein
VRAGCWWLLGQAFASLPLDFGGKIKIVNEGNIPNINIILKHLCYFSEYCKENNKNDFEWLERKFVRTFSACSHGNAGIAVPSPHVSILVCPSSSIYSFPHFRRFLWCASHTRIDQCDWNCLFSGFMFYVMRLLYTEK